MTYDNKTLLPLNFPSDIISTEKTLDMPLESIAQITGLSQEEIEALQF